MLPHHPAYTWANPSCPPHAGPAVGPFLQPHDADCSGRTLAAVGDSTFFFFFILMPGTGAELSASRKPRPSMAAKGKSVKWNHQTSFTILVL